jgi:hypothetical protein
MGICVTILFSFSGGTGDFTLTGVNSGLGSAIHTLFHMALVFPAEIFPNAVFFKEHKPALGDELL